MDPLASGPGTGYGALGANLGDALNSLPAPRLIAGSLYLAGEALALNGERPG